MISDKVFSRDFGITIGDSKTYIKGFGCEQMIYTNIQKLFDRDKRQQVTNMDFFSFDRNDFLHKCNAAPTKALQKRELHYTRSVQAHCGGVGAGTGATVATAGAAFPLPLISLRFFEVAWDKLKIIQLVLISRCVQLHITDSTDFFIGLGAVTSAQLAAVPMDGIVNGGVGLGDWTNVAAEVIKAVPGEVVQGAVVEVSVSRPPKKCPRRKMYQHLRLKCKMCERCFDTSYTEFLRKFWRCPFLKGASGAKLTKMVDCCDCDEDYDVCATCVPKISHSTTHTIYKLSPECPKIRSSWRAKLGHNPSCKGCAKTLANEDYYGRQNSDEIS